MDIHVVQKTSIQKPARVCAQPVAQLQAEADKGAPSTSSSELSPWERTQRPLVSRRGCSQEPPALGRFLLTAGDGAAVQRFPAFSPSVFPNP